ncbi:Molecular chaperone of the family [Olea europaea subsp. europaea]|uniref:Molecular chaperone of the family n=1 Tax=Olea europaea subsp. europaea TaxID=158383 RepID=A0A8S0VMS9_OLEEU|nr:Molecular chaperone of the family [Olea europaea subsp. europaea]
MRIFSSVYHQTSVRPPGHHLSARHIITAILLNYAPPARNRTLLRNVAEYQSSTRPLMVSGQVSWLRHSNLNSSTIQCFGFTSTASSHPNEKEISESENKQEIKRDDGANAAAVDVPDQTEASVMDKKDESDSEIELSRDDLMKLLTEKEEHLKVKQMEHEQMKDKVLRTLAEMENVKDRTKREADNAKKFAIQNFSKSLLDVADNLGRASSAAKESFLKIETSNDDAGAVSLLKTLLEGVEMTEKQLIEVFKKFGVEKYDAMNEEFDPNRHNAVFQVPDASKPANHVAVVLKRKVDSIWAPSHPFTRPSLTPQKRQNIKINFNLDESQKREMVIEEAR